MTTDITELALREKFEAWLSEKPLHARYVHWCGALKAYDYASIQLAWEAYQAGSAELVEALEKAQTQIIALQQNAEIDPRTHEIIDLQERIAELEVSHTKLRESMAAIHNTICRDGAFTSLATILNAAKRAHEESGSAAGIKVEAE